MPGPPCPTPCRVRFATAAAVVGALTGMVPAQAWGSPEDVFGFGPRSSAMGATGAAIGEGFEAVHGDPALLSLARERQLSLGFLGAVFDMRAPSRLNYGPLRGSFIGAVLPIPFGGVLKDRVGLGLGFFTPFDLVVRGRILYPETLQFLTPDRTQSVAVQVGLGIDLGWGIRIGGGFAALAALTGTVVVATDASGRIGTVVEDTLVASYGPIVGASYDIGKHYRVGAVFRGELKGPFNVVIHVRDLGQIVVPPLNISGLAQYDPWQIAFEIARVKGPWKLAIGATYKHWAAYPGPFEATVRCPANPATGEPAEDCGALEPPDPGYSVTVVPRLGAERSFEPARGVGMHVRAGYFFEPSPAPEQTGKANLFDNHRSVLTFGYGLSLHKPLPGIQLDLFSQFHVLHPRTHVKGPEAPAATPGAPEIHTAGFIVAGGATAGIKF